jgi:hypothetical protein
MITKSNDVIIKHKCQHVKLKRCHCCKRKLDIKTFYKMKASQDGLQHKCKYCISEYYEDHKTYRAKYYKKWYNINKK